MTAAVRDGVRVRVARTGDLLALDRLFARAYPRLLKADYPPSIRVTALPLISRAQPALLTAGTFFVAETEALDIVGAGGWTRSRRRGQGDVRHMVADDRLQRCGIGRAVMETVFASARAAGINRLDCLSTRTAVPFYRAMGFRHIGAVEITLRPGIDFPAHHMLRAL